MITYADKPGQEYEGPAILPNEKYSYTEDTFWKCVHPVLALIGALLLLVVLLKF